MHRLGITLDQGRLVADDLPEAGTADDLERVAAASPSGDIALHRLDRRGLFTVHELIAALRFALERELRRRKRLGELARDVEQIRQLPALKLELDLAERRRASSCMDRAPIERQGDCPLVVCQRVDLPAHASLVLSLEQTPEFPLRHRLERGTS